MAFDYLNSVEETIVAKGLEGKIIMVYGGNNLGKSKQATNFPSPVVLPFESSALNAIGGAKKLPVHDWATFRDFVDSVYKDKVSYEKDLANLAKQKAKEVPKDKEEKEAYEAKIERLQKKVDDSSYAKFKEMFKTIIVDTVTALDKSIEKYIVDEAEVRELGDIDFGKLYKRLENEAFHTLNRFFNLGDFTYVVIAHEDFREYGEDDEGEAIYQAYPKGDAKRVIKPIVDLCDIVLYLKSNGLDENHRVVPSSAIMGECNMCFARSKWDNMDLYIEEFSAENLEKVIEKAISEQEESGVKVGTHREQQQSHINDLTVDFEEIQSEILSLAKKIYAHDDEDIEGVNMTKYNDIVEEFLGQDRKVSEATSKQVGSLKNILSRTKDLMEELV